MIGTISQEILPTKINNSKAGKIILNSPYDLLELSEVELESEDIANFLGIYFDKLHEEALKIEYKNKVQKEFKSPVNIGVISKAKTEISSSLNNQKKAVEDIKNKNEPERLSRLSSTRIEHEKKSEEKKVIVKGTKTLNKSAHFKPINDNSNIENNKSYQKTQSMIKNIGVLVTDNNDSFITSDKKVFKSFYKGLNDSLITSDIQKNNFRKLLNNSDSADKKVNSFLNKSLMNNFNTYTKGKNIISDNENIRFYVKKLIIFIQCDTAFGEDVGILGSIPKLGNWDKNKIWFLSWNQGNIWAGEVNIEDIPINKFEFKFVISQHNTVKFWESGNNNKVDFTEMIHKMKYHKKGKYDKYEYIFNIINGELTFLCQWTYR